MAVTLQHPITAGTVIVNGTELYYERRGRGPSVLLISGATGDAGHFTAAADQLADEFDVTCYDRRGNSRSPQPAGLDTTTMAEQADDAAGLISALGLGPVVVFGTSGGAVIALDLLLRHPSRLAGVLLHEPPLLGVLPDAAEIGAQIQPVIEAGMAAGGPRGAVEAFIRFNAGDAAYEGIEPAVRERMLDNGDTLFGCELDQFITYLPPDADLAAVHTPVHVLAGKESAPFFGAAASWLADRLGVDVRATSGAHTPYFDRPEQFVAELRPLLRQASGVERTG